VALVKGTHTARQDQELWDGVRVPGKQEVSKWTWFRTIMSVKLIQLGSKYFERGVRDSELEDGERGEQDGPGNMVAGLDFEDLPWKALTKHYKTSFDKCMPPSQHDVVDTWADDGEAFEEWLFRQKKEVCNHYTPRVSLQTHRHHVCVVM